AQHQQHGEQREARGPVAARGGSERAHGRSHQEKESMSLPSCSMETSSRYTKPASGGRPSAGSRAAGVTRLSTAKTERSTFWRQPAMPGATLQSDRIGGE